MDVALVTWTAASAAIGSLVTGYTLATLQHRRSIKDAGLAEVAAQMRLTRFEAVRQLNGEARSLTHCLSYLTPDVQRFGYSPYGRRNSIQFYIEKAKELSAEMRELARSEVYVLGEPYVAAVLEATDIANLIVDLCVSEQEEARLRVSEQEVVALHRKAHEVIEKWWERIPDDIRELGHLGIYQVFERALYEVFTLAAAPDLPSPSTKQSARTTRTPSRSGAIGRSQSPETQMEAQEPSSSQQDLPEVEAQEPSSSQQDLPEVEAQEPSSSSQQDLPLRLEAKNRSPEP
jgi:hypothetical protein